MPQVLPQATHPLLQQGTEPPRFSASALLPYRLPAHRSRIGSWWTSCLLKSAFAVSRQTRLTMVCVRLGIAAKMLP